MKKITITVLALILALGCMLGTTACGNDKEIAVTDIALSKTELTLNEGDTAVLTVEFTPKNATNKSVKWTSDNPTCVKVERGAVTALAAGLATVTATAGEKSASCIVIVQKPKMTSEEWAACVAVFDETTNFTETHSDTATGDEIRTIMRDGDKFSEEKMNGEADIYQKTGSAYAHYKKESAADWTKSEADEQMFLLALTVSLKSDVAKVLIDNYDDMDYDGISYTLTETEYKNIKITDIEVYVDNGKIIAVMFDAENFGYVKIGNLGITEITIPAV